MIEVGVRRQQRRELERELVIAGVALLFGRNVDGERAELAEGDRFRVDDATAGVVDVEGVFFARLEGVGVVADPADDALEVHEFAFAVGRPVAVEVALRCQSDGEIQTLQIADRRGGVAFVDGEHAKIGDGFQFGKRLLQHAVFAGNFLKTGSDIIE